MYDNEQLSLEVSQNFELSLDLRSLGGEGYGLSREIDCKLDVLLSRQNLYPVPRNDLHLNVEQMVDDFVCNDDSFDSEEEEDIISSH